MPGKRVSIAQVMMLIALAAVNLAVARVSPVGIVTYPSLWVALGGLDFLIVRKLIQRRSFDAFHYTFLITLLVSFFVMAYAVSVDSFNPLALVVRYYQRLVSGVWTSRVWWEGYAWVGEFWAVAFLSVALASTAGLGAAYLERRRKWDIAAFWRGALLGLLVAYVLVAIDDAAAGFAQQQRYSARLIGRLVLLGVGLVLGGVIGPKWLRSRRPA
jgi:hypothetical protein